MNECPNCKLLRNKLARTQLELIIQECESDGQLLDDLYDLLKDIHTKLTMKKASKP